MTTQEKINKIIEIIESGRNVYFTTYINKTTVVSKRTLNRFRKAGHELFKAQGNSIMMLNGKKYICMNGCKITVDSE